MFTNTVYRVSLTIDGNKCYASAGQNLLECLIANGIEITSPCFGTGHHKPGWCGLCMVEAGGKNDTKRSLVKACCTNVTEGMTVRTESKCINQARKGNLEKLFRKHYRKETCENCIWEGDCVLHHLAREYGIRVKD